MSNSAAFAELDRMIEACRSMALIPREAAPLIGAKLEQLLAASNSAGTSPEGAAWAATKAGNLPLRGAMGAIKVDVITTRIIVTLTGHYVFHQRGTTRTPARPMIPAMLDAKMAGAIREIYRKRFEAKVAV